MKHPCQEFRSLLELALEGRPSVAALEAALPQLAWHEHLLACGECRTLLQAEEALEILLATLPEPKLPPHLARRVVSRLRDARQAETRLDALLELDRSARAPAHLARTVLAALESARGHGARLEPAEAEVALDRLLDADRRIAAPSGLAERVLFGLQAARASERVAPELASARAASASDAPVRARRSIWLRSAWPYAAAAGILATWIGWIAWERGETKPRGASDDVVQRQADAAPDADLLAALDVLEHWDLLRSEDVDVLLSSTIDPADEALLEFEAPEAPSPPQSDKETEPPSKG